MIPLAPAKLRRLATEFARVDHAMMEVGSVLAWFGPAYARAGVDLASIGIASPQLVDSLSEVSPADQAWLVALDAFARELCTTFASRPAFAEHFARSMTAVGSDVRDVNHIELPRAVAAWISGKDLTRWSAK